MNRLQKINYLNITASNIAAIGISKISAGKKSIEKVYPKTLEEITGWNNRTPV